MQLSNYLIDFNKKISKLTFLKTNFHMGLFMYTTEPQTNYNFLFNCLTGLGASAAVSVVAYAAVAGSVLAVPAAQIIGSIAVIASLAILTKALWTLAHSEKTEHANYNFVLKFLAGITAVAGFGYILGALPIIAAGFGTHNAYSVAFAMDHISFNAIISIASALIGAAFMLLQCRKKGHLAFSKPGIVHLATAMQHH